MNPQNMSLGSKNEFFFFLQTSGQGIEVTTSKTSGIHSSTFSSCLDVKWLALFNHKLSRADNLFIDIPLIMISCPYRDQ